MTNRQRGFRRLLIVAVCLYFVFWASVALWAWNTHLYFEAHYNPKASFDDLGNASLFAMDSESSEQMKYAVWFGLFLPVCILPFLPVALWVYRGFKPKGDK
jgi:hypothetical protein